MNASDTPRWQATPLDEDDQESVRYLFEEVFGVPMSEALWRWKYGGGRGCAWGIRESCSSKANFPLAVVRPVLVAHYGGTRRSLVVNGRAIDGIQMGDVMVRSDSRGVLSRNGPFAVVARGFIDAHVGPAHRNSIGFGFPSTRHAKLGELLGLYRALGEVRELRWRTNAGPKGFGWRRELDEIDVDASHFSRGSGRQLDDVWKRMREALCGWVLPERDANWLCHRYLEHPHHHYQLAWLRCRWTRRRLGALIVRHHQGHPEPSGPSWEWVDWIGPPKHLRRALFAAAAAASNAGVETLYGWFSAPVIDRYLAPVPPSDSGFGPASSTVCTWCVTASRSDQGLGGIDSAPWWLTSGDTDFR